MLLPKSDSELMLQRKLPIRVTMIFWKENTGNGFSRKVLKDFLKTPIRRTDFHLP